MAEFSEQEEKRLEFLKQERERGRIGGPEDKPSEGREFVMHPESTDLLWKNLPPELHQTYEERFGKKGEAVEVREQVKKGEAMLVAANSVMEAAWYALQAHDPSLGISIRRETPNEGYTAVSYSPEKAKDMLWKVDSLLEDPVVHALSGDPADNAPFIEDLEKQGRLPKGILRRLIAREHAQHQKSFERLLQLSPDVPLRMQHEIQKAISDEQAMIEQMEAAPLTNEELKEILIQRLGELFRDKQQGSIGAPQDFSEYMEQFRKEMEEEENI